MMGTFRRKLLFNAFRLFDLLVLIVSFVLAAVLTRPQGLNGSSLESVLAIRITVRHVSLFALLMLAWHVILSLFGLYLSKRFSPRRQEFIDIIQATSMGTLFLLAASLAFRISIVTPEFIVLFWLFSTSITFASRIALRAALKWFRLHGRNLRHMLIIGTNSRAVSFAHQVESLPEVGFHIIGFADQSWAGIEKFKGSGFRLVSDLDNLLEFLRNSVVDEVVFALPMKSQYERAAGLAALCEEQGIAVRFLSSIVDLKRTHFRVEDQVGDSLVAASHHRDGWPIAVKVAIDFTFSLILLILLSPLFVMAALAIRLSSSGPVFFGQQRLGLNKRRFTIYKFRTMVPDAEKRLKEIEHLNEAEGPVFKIKDDPRITSAGKLLRRTSIDELPQLFNVLKGDMSLVGPRPLPVRDFEGFNEDWQRRRFSVRPGITCLWQINGRSSIEFGKWMELDMEYLDKWSLWLDFEILVRTIPAVLKGSGAA